MINRSQLQLIIMSKLTILKFCFDNNILRNFMNCGICNKEMNLEQVDTINDGFRW